MNTSHIAHLMHQYLQAKLTTKEYKTLKESVRIMDDRELETLLRQEWDQYENRARNMQACQRIYRQIQPTIARPHSHFSLPAGIWKIAASICIPLLLSAVVYLYTTRQQYQKLAHTEFSISTGKGEHSTLTLPEGTQIYLNSNSTLSYPAVFTGQQRKVKLSGEAYCKVSHHPERPFIIQTQTADIRVLGTEFNVSAYPQDDFFETTLVKGLVELWPVSGTHTTAIRLKPHQKASMNKFSGKWTVSATDLWLETAWTRGDLIFRSLTLKEVFRRLGNFYGTDIQVQGNYPTGLFTGSFHEDTINGILLNLQQHYKFSYHKTGNSLNIQFQ